jgi:hypothetical protein
MVVPGKSVTVEGLRTNDTYVFAIAAYDESGQLLGGLGASSQEVGRGTRQGGGIGWPARRVHKVPDQHVYNLCNTHHSGLRQVT